MLSCPRLLPPDVFFSLSRWRERAGVREGFNKRLRGLLAAIVLLTPFAAQADPDLLSIGVGGTDILNQQTRAAGDLRLEYRFGVSLLPLFEQYFKVKPLIAGETTTRQSVFGGGGIWLDIPIGTHFALTPQVVVGGYGQGNGKNLGSPFEIRSTFEAGYIFDNQTRLSASFSHTSNGGVARHNPGTEAVVISFQIPITSLVGRR